MQIICVHLTVFEFMCEEKEEERKSNFSCFIFLTMRIDGTLGVHFTLELEVKISCKNEPQVGMALQKVQKQGRYENTKGLP